MDKLASAMEESKLIAKKIAGQLDEQEEEQFLTWLDSSPDNRQLFQRLQDFDNFEVRNKEYEGIDITQAWADFAEKAHIQPKSRFLSVFMKYAAMVVMALTAGGIYWYLNQPVEGPVVAKVVTDIKQGAQNAYLVLNDGQSVDLENAANQMLVEADGTVIQRNGQGISYEAQDLKKSKGILKNTLVVPRGGEYCLVLADGTKVHVNSMSKLVFPVRFTGATREVALEGEAYFEVKKDAKHPFILEINGMHVRVLGTSFNVKAYPDEKEISTTLVEGKVRIDFDARPGKEWFLAPDQQAVLHRESTDVSIQTVDARQFMQWTTGRYVFPDQTLDEIMITLSRWYEFTYKYSDESLKNIRFEGGLNKYESIDPILDIINRTGKVKVSVKGTDILFEK